MPAPWLLRSAPAQKALPLPVSTTTRTPGSSIADSKMSREFREQLRGKRVPTFGAIQPDPGSPIADLVFASSPLPILSPRPSASIAIGIAAQQRIKRGHRRPKESIAQSNAAATHFDREAPIMFPVIEPCQAHWGETRASGLIDPAPAVRMMLVQRAGSTAMEPVGCVGLRPHDRSEEIQMNDEVIITCAVTGAGTRWACTPRYP